MFSPIEDCWPCLFRALAAACTVFLCATGCSSREDLIATVTLEAGVQDAGDVADCKPTFTDAQDMGVDLYFIIEHSGENFSEWQPLTSALANLFGSSAPEFAGMGVGLGIYPKTVPPPQSCLDACPQPVSCNCLRNCGCWDWNGPPDGQACACRQWWPSCSETDYPPTLDITRASENPDDFWSALLTIDPEPQSFTDQMPLVPALAASLRHRNEWEDQNRGRRITQVLIANALQFDCQFDDRDISEVEKALSGPEKPKTYVVGVNPSGPDDGRDFDRLATAGRTSPALQLTVRTRPPPTNPTVPLAEFIERIRAAEGRCEYLLPAPGPGIDFTKVNLAAISGGLQFRKVANRAACANDDQGWFFDTDETPDPNDGPPRRVIACEGTCRRLHGGQDAGLTSGAARIQTGCPTIYARDAGR
jgi:hypothetical protein